jgi:hypothetical protein
MTRTVKRSNSKAAKGIRYDTVVSVKTTKRVKDRLVEMAREAEKIYPDYLRLMLERHVAENEAKATH